MPNALKFLGGLSFLLLATACVPETIVVREPRPYSPPARPPEVVGVYIEAPIGQPEPIACQWAPPPMLVEAPPPPPREGTFWTGGYWVWQGTWVWAHGRWAAPPRPGYGWRQPYYENRDGIVVFIGGHWADPRVAFVPPPPTMRFTLESARPGVIPGPRPMGPSGIFVPAPPGSRLGIIVPAPLGTSPAVVTGAPPVVNVGMRITNNINNGTISNSTNISNNRTTVINNITNVTIVAPPSATASGQAVNSSVPAQAHLAAAMPPVVRAPAPVPASQKPIPAFVHDPRPAAPPQASAPSPRPANPAPAPLVHAAPPLPVPAPQRPGQAPPSLVHPAPVPPVPAPQRPGQAPPSLVHPAPVPPVPAPQRPVKPLPSQGHAAPAPPPPAPIVRAAPQPAKAGQPASPKPGNPEEKKTAEEDKAKARDHKKTPDA